MIRSLAEAPDVLGRPPPRSVEAQGPRYTEGEHEEALPHARAVVLAGLTGVLGAGCFRGTLPWPMIFVALVPLVYAVACIPRPAERFALGWVAGVVGHGLAFSWITPAVARLQSVSSGPAAACTALFVAYAACQFGCFALLVGCWRNLSSGAQQGPRARYRSYITWGCFVASAWVLLEWGFPKLFPWSFGQILGESSVLRQAADLGGVYGLGFLVALANVALAVALLARQAPFHIRYGLLAATVILACGTGAYGVAQLAGSDAAATAGTQKLEVALVQGGLPVDPGAPAVGDDGWQVYSSLTRTFRHASGSSKGSVRRPDLVVWPESVLRGFLSLESAYRHRVEALVREIGAPLLLGAPDLRVDDGGEANAAYLLVDPAHRAALPPTSLVQVYHKMRLLPFGEYVPGVSVLPILGRWRTTGQFVAGMDSQAATFAVPLDLSSGAMRVRLAPSICYEAIWPGAFNRQVNGGAHVLVNLTDDSWFEGTIAPAEHLRAVALRAVETRRWLVRASNSGVSAIIDPTGQIVASIPWMAPGVVSHPVEVRTATTLYTRAGDWPLIGCGLLAVACLFRARELIVPLGDTFGVGRNGHASA